MIIPHGNSFVIKVELDTHQAAIMLVNDVGPKEHNFCVHRTIQQNNNDIVL